MHIDMYNSIKRTEYVLKVRTISGSIRLFCLDNCEKTLLCISYTLLFLYIDVVNFVINNLCFLNGGHRLNGA